MQYDPLDDFFDVLSDRSAGIMTTRSLMAVCGGVFLGYLAGALVAIGGAASILLPLVCALFSYILTYDYQGLLIVQRIRIAVTFWLGGSVPVAGAQPPPPALHALIILDDDPIVRR